MVSSGKRTVCYIVAYDISDDKRRTKVHKVLCGFGQWTQYSLFECFLTSKERLLLQDKLDRILEPEEDSLRFYRLCEGCLSKLRTVGSPKPKEPTVFVV